MRPLILFIQIVTGCSVAFCQQVINIATVENFTSQTVTTAPTRTVANLDSGINVTYTFDYMLLDSHANNTYVISFEDFGMTSIPDMPHLPVKLDAFQLETHQNATVKLVNYTFVEYPFEIALTEDFTPESEVDCSNHENSPINQGEPTSQLHQDVLYTDIQTYRDKKICYVNVMPVIYNSENRTVKVATSLTYRINFSDFEEPLPAAHSVKSDLSPILSNILINSDIALNSPNKSKKIASYNQSENYLIDTPADYLIISTPTFASSVNYFAEWKKMLGFRPHIVLKDNWESASVVRDSIYQYYQMYPYLNYLLIVGGANDVPADTKVSYNNTGTHLTDYYYGCMGEETEFKYIPDIHRGRIPASTNKEAEIAINKIIAYEMCEQSPPDFFNSSLHVAYFEDKDKNGYEDARFTLTSEEILDAARNNGLFPNRVYACSPGSTPQFYTDDNRYQANGIKLPEELLSHSFNWRGNSSDINAIMKKGTHYVLYRGHGGVNSWANYNSSNIKDSQRSDTPLQSTYGITETIHPIIYSITCKTGIYSASNCISLASLFNEYCGASAVIAASDLSYSGPNDAFALGIFDAIFDSGIESTYVKARQLSYAYKPVLRLGQILDQGLYRMIEKFNSSEIFGPPILKTLNPHQCEVFHCFGDPSILIRTKEPTPFNDVSISFDSNTNFCTVSTGEGPAIISFYDKNVDKVESYFDEVATFKFSQAPSVTPLTINSLIQNENVTITGPNRKPYRVNWLNILSKVPQYALVLTDNNVLSAKYGSSSTERDIFVNITRISDGIGVMKTSCPPDQTETTIDISTLPTGLYVASLIENGIIKTSTTIQKK